MTYRQPLIVPMFLLFACCTTASGQFVPRNWTLYYYGGSGYGGFGYGGAGQAITPQGDVLRGQGQYLQGYGGYLHGAADQLRASGENEYRRPEIERQDLENRLRMISARRTLKSQLESDRSAKQVQQRKDLETKRTLEHRDQPSVERITSGEAINYLMKRLGSGVLNVDQNSLDLNDDELATVRLQTADGLTLDEIQKTMTDAGQIAWPDSLSGGEYSTERTAVDELMQELANGQVAGAAQQQQIKQLLGRLRDLEKKATVRLGKQRQSMSVLFEARGFLQRLQSMVGSYDRLNPQSAKALLVPEVTTVEELLRHIAVNNLRFAPVDADGVPTYSRIHAAFAEADRQVNVAAAAH